MKYHNGDIYEGNFDDQLPNGIGKITLKNSAVFEGVFKNGQPWLKKNPKFISSQYGTLLCQYSKDYFEGQLENGLPKEKGHGSINYLNGRFEGTFSRGIP